MPLPPRTFHIYDRGQTYDIFGSDDKTCNYIVKLSGPLSFRLSAVGSPDSDRLVGRAIYHVVKNFIFFKRTDISVHNGLKPDRMTLDKEGMLFGNKRILRGSALGMVYFWTKVGGPETSFMICSNCNGRPLAEYREASNDIKKMGCLEIKKDLVQEALDELVLCAMAAIPVARVS